jgi:ATP-binding cassette subfamily F protein uup
LLVSHDRDFLDRVVTSTLANEGNGNWVEYAGGYSDMLLQRGAGPVATPDRVRSSSKGGTSSKSAAKKLSFKDKHALETLPADIARLNNQIQVQQRRLSDPNLYRRDPAAFKLATDTLSDAQAKLAAAEERWLELEMLREELGA